MRSLFHRCWHTVLLLVLVSAGSGCHAASPLRAPQSFTYTGDVGFGNSVFVVGDHPDVGNNSPTGAVKLRWTSGNVWTANVALQSGTALQYKFIRRSTAPTQICNPANSTDLGPVLSLKVPGQPAAPYPGKTILYHSPWSQAFILYRAGTNWLSAEMTRLGAGRTNGEYLFRLAGIGEAGEPLEFVPNDGAGQWDNPAGGGNYLTSLDVVFVQDKNVFNYQPPATVSPPTIQTTTVNSSYPAILARTVRIYLPRGYTQNTWKRYPVFYLHDGQNVFDPGGPFGSWSADAVATTEICQGRMRECILVGVDNTANRIAEYMPPTDSYSGNPGVGDRYRDYVTNNVRAYVDGNFRTLTDPTNTLSGGSSLGGLITLYFGRESTAFGKIAILSPAFWIAPTYLTQVRGRSKKPARVYLDVGTAESDSAWNDCLSFYDTLLSQSYAPNGDMFYVTGCGDQHNEAAWKKRLPGVFRYLLNPGDEPNPLAQREYPPKIRLTTLNPVTGQATLYFPTLLGFSYDLQRSTNLSDWISVASTPTELFPWSTQQVADVTISSGLQRFWRLRDTTTP